jgi:hypothetical protein
MSRIYVVYGEPNLEIGGALETPGAWHRLSFLGPTTPGSTGAYLHDARKRDSFTISIPHPLPRLEGCKREVVSPQPELGLTLIHCIASWHRYGRVQHAVRTLSLGSTRRATFYAVHGRGEMREE